MIFKKGKRRNGMNNEKRREHEGDIAEANIKIAEENHQLILRLKETLTNGFLLLGEKLSKCQKEQLYLVLGYDTFEEYIASPDIGFKRSWVYDLMRIYRTFVEQLKISPEKLQRIGVTKLLTIETIVNNSNYNDWLEKANVLSISDLQKERLTARQEIQGREVEEVILCLSARQVTELFLLLNETNNKLYDELYKKILEYKEFRLIRNLQIGEIWKAESLE